MIIRKARLNDLEAIGRHYARLFSEMAALQPDCLTSAEQSPGFIINAINSPGYLMLTAEDDNGEVVGFAMAREQSSPPYPCLQPRRLAYLMDMSVEPKFRELGLGSAFIERIKAWALNRGLEYMELNVLEENYRALELYERLGFRSSNRTMRLKL